MPVVFPTTLDDTTTFPVAATLTTETLADEPHSKLHEELGTAVLALEAKVGINSSSDVDSLDYKINHLSDISVPTGGIIPFAGTTEPAGFKFCNGQSLSTTTFAALHAVILFTYGGSGGAFNVPDLRGRAPVGLDNFGGSGAAGRIASLTALGASGGAATVALVTGEMPNHNHAVTVSVTGISGSVSGTTGSGGSHTHPVAYDVISYAPGGSLGPFARIFESSLGNGGTQNTNSASPSTHTHSFSGSFSGTASGTGSSGTAGSGTAHNNLQPYIGLNYIIAL